jgi:hypothetical protein
MLFFKTAYPSVDQISDSVSKTILESLRERVKFV